MHMLSGSRAGASLSITPVELSGALLIALCGILASGIASGVTGIGAPLDDHPMVESFETN